MQIFNFVKLAASSTFVALVLAPAISSVSAMASPGPYPMPFQNADYSAHILPGPSRTHYSHRWHRAVDHNTTMHSGHHDLHSSSSSGTVSKHKYKSHMTSPSAMPMPASSRLHRRQGASLDVLLQSLGGFSSGSQSDSQDLRECQWFLIIHARF